MTTSNSSTVAERRADAALDPGLTLANARMVLPDRVVTGHLRVEKGKIVGIVEGAHMPAGAIDLAGEVLMPGLVEVHTDNLERHMQPRPGVDLAHNTAILAHDGEVAACGVTTVFDALRVGSSAREGVDFNAYARDVATEILMLQKAGALRARHLIHLRAEVCSDTLSEELSEFVAEDRVGLVSVMDHTPGQRQFRDLDKLRVYYKGKHGFDDGQFDQVVAVRRALGDRNRSRHVAAAIGEAGRLGAVLASHDDTTRAHVAASYDMGARLAEFPTTIEAAEACREMGMRIIAGAPNLIRGGSHSGNVSVAELAAHDLVDIVSSDYVPSLLCASVFRLAELWNDLPRAVRTVSVTPADSTGLSHLGRLETGCSADLVHVGQFGQTPVVRQVWREGRRIA